MEIAHVNQGFFASDLNYCLHIGSIQSVLGLTSPPGLKSGICTIEVKLMAHQTFCIGSNSHTMSKPSHLRESLMSSIQVQLMQSPGTVHLAI